MRFGIRLNKRPTLNVQLPTSKLSELNAGRLALGVGRSALGVCFSRLFRDISRPNESSDQPVVGVFCSGGPAHGARDLDATSKERRPGCSVWRGGAREHFRRTN